MEYKLSESYNNKHHTAFTVSVSHSQPMRNHNAYILNHKLGAKPAGQ